jgi:hypothetical protein
MSRTPKIAMATALILATLVATVASSYANPYSGYHRLGYTRDQSTNGG